MSDIKLFQLKNGKAAELQGDADRAALSVMVTPMRELLPQGPVLTGLLASGKRVVEVISTGATDGSFRQLPPDAPAYPRGMTI